MKKLDKLKNTFSALITPFNEHGEVDWDKLKLFLKFQIENGVGLVPCGTTGESATLTYGDHHKIIEYVVQEAKKSKEKPFVLAGTGSNSTREAIDLTEHACEAGVDGVLLITPYYNKPTQRGLYEHFKLIAETTDLPIVIYNVPGRTSCNILPETTAKLAKIPNIVGYKAADGNLDQIKKVIELCPKDFIVMSGDDNLTYDIMKMGGKGVISVASNVMPKRINQMTHLLNEGKWDEGKKMSDDLQEFFKTLFIETNPGPVKYMAELMGFMSSRMRLPMVSPEQENCEKIKAVAKKYQLI
jgi:4-hydroxy-tetrahydrodipicolinate synthase